jgi:shikimate dehydrogenase
MLVSQGIAAAERFLDRKIPKERVEEIIGKLESQMMNIALIAMPGAGKTSCGKKLEKLTGRKLVDMDAEIVKKIGCTIPELFAEKGEDAFRKVETEVLREFSKKSGLIIATGGGVVTRDENYPLLHQNSHIVFLAREDMTQLSKKGRPVSQSTPIEKLIRERMPKYRGWSDLTIRCVNPYENAKKIIKELKL